MMRICLKSWVAQPQWFIKQITDLSTCYCSCYSMGYAVILGQIHTVLLLSDASKRVKSQAVFSNYGLINQLELSYLPIEVMYVYTYIYIYRIFHGNTVPPFMEPPILILFFWSKPWYPRYPKIAA